MTKLSELLRRAENRPRYGNEPSSAYPDTNGIRNALMYAVDGTYYRQGSYMKTYQEHEEAVLGYSIFVMQVKMPEDILVEYAKREITLPATSSIFDVMSRMTFCNWSSSRAADYFESQGF